MSIKRDEPKNIIIARLQFELKLLDSLKREVEEGIKSIHKELLLELIENREYDLLKINFTKLSNIRRLSALADSTKDDILKMVKSKVGLNE